MGTALPARPPAGFDPVWVAAVSPSTYWVLGTVSCPGHVCGTEAAKTTSHHCDQALAQHATPRCTWLVRTDDDGASFVDLPAPPAPLLKGTYNAGSEGIDAISFANPQDGFAYATSTTVGAAGSFWETHDGGRTWSEPAALANRFVVAAATGDGLVLVLVSGDCQGLVCSDGVLMRSPVGRDDWEGLSLPVPVTPNWGASITVVGRYVWIRPPQPPCPPTSSTGRSCTLTTRGSTSARS